MKRRDVPAWVLPGGGIGPEERPEVAVVREVEEETGYRVRLVRKVAEYDYTDNRETGHLFECGIIGGKPTLNPEAKAIVFFPVNRLPEVRHPTVSQMVGDALAEKKTLIRKTLRQPTAL